MALDESWELNERGQVKFAALMGYSMATMPRGGLVRIEYASSAEEIQQRSISGLQLHLDAPLAREIGQALLLLADQLEQQGSHAEKP
jgi:hypothetical protein